jgi:ribosomal protein L12E/L44/L45/RPP1/RPP2
MRLAALLAELPADQLERLAAEHLGQDENVSRTALCATLEGVLRSYSFVRKFVGDRFPPTFSILEVLLDADDWTCPAASFRDAVAERTAALVDRVKTGDLVGRDASLRLYRRVLVEARRNDLVLDASETAILGVLRRELVIRPAEHFLIEHHSDFHEFWAKEDAFLSEMNALRSCGLVFGHAGNILLAEEVVPLVRQTLGFEMASASRRRLLGRLSGGDLAEILGKCELKTSGTRDEKLERLLASYVQPSEVLRLLPLQTLRDICRDANASVSGSKDELVDRLVDHFLHTLDIKPHSELPPPPLREPEARALDEVRFRALFSSLKGDDLTDILAGIDSSRITGAKDTKVALLVDSMLAETSLLEKLTNRALEETLSRMRLRTAGSKRERIDRLLEYFRTVHESLLGLDAPPSSVAVVDVLSPPVADGAGSGPLPE